MTALRSPIPGRRVTPFDDPDQRFIAGRFGMWLLLATLGMLFAASIIGFVVLRIAATDPARPPLPSLPPLPVAIWIATALLIASSVTMQFALVAARRGRPGAVVAGMIVTTLLGLAFVGVQIVAWRAWLAPAEAALASSGDAHVYMILGFYVLTGLHAAHVIGGLIPMLVVTARALLGRYTPARHDGVQYCAMYWHFLDAVWMALFLLLLLGTP
ncbi:MAG: heme-copper oxidase subunit III [Phycisphaerales bacterium]|nr:heme-copper oxidase subunit III [Phycisphaerales bacterium]